MAGFTNSPTRVMALRFGADAVYTEMAGVEGLVHEHTDETWQLLETSHEEAGRVWAHLYGAKPLHFAMAASMIAKTGRFAGIDINAGCPVPKVTRGGGGAALMRSPALLGEIVKAAREASGLPVSVKTRLGFSRNEITVFRLLEEAQRAGASSFSIHGRFKHQGHAGEVGFDLVRELKSNSSIPVFGNGGIRDAASAAEFAGKTGVDGLLIGQGAIGHPWVFGEIASERDFTGAASRSSYLGLDEIRSVLFVHMELERAFSEHLSRKYPNARLSLTPDDILVIRFRVHLFRYLSGLRGAGFMRGGMSSLRTPQDCMRAIDACLECEKKFRERGAQEGAPGAAPRKI